MEQTVFAYLAGAMDSDGYFNIKRKMYGVRFGGDTNPSYEERAGLKQVTPQIPQLLRECFGGSLLLGKASLPNGRALYTYAASHIKAVTLCEALLPYLRIKRRQAELILELRKSRNPIYEHEAYWFAQEFPNWQTMELLTSAEVCNILRYQNPIQVSQAVTSGILLALPYVRNGVAAARPRIPRLLVERIAANVASDGRSSLLPPQLVAWRERLFVEMHALNQTGVATADVA